MDPDPVLMTKKLKKKITDENFFWIFFGSKNAFYLSLGLEVQVIGEALSLKREHPVQQFLYFCGSFWPFSTALLIVQKSRVYPPLFRSNYFHKESTLFEKSNASKERIDSLSRLTKSLRGFFP